MKDFTDKNLVNVVIPPLVQAFTYDVPKNLLPKISVGHLVEVPFGRRVAQGYIIEKITEEKKTDFKIKSIRDSEEQHACFNSEQLIFFKWIAEYYSEPLSNVIDVAIPSPAIKKYNRWISLQTRTIENLKGSKQKAIVELLKKHEQAIEYSEILKTIKGSATVIKKLAEKNIIKIIEEELIDAHISEEEAPNWTKNKVELDAAQLEAKEKILCAANEDLFKVFTLFGVTGSGKTEVYIEAIQKIVADGKGALIIVPEIALTPQLIDRFRARLGNEIAILHSGLSKRTRWDSWRALLEKRNFIAIGARSAIFAPVPNLGLIIVDEEHDGSYKQAQQEHYITYL